MLRKQKQRQISKGIEQSLQSIHSLVTRAICPPLPIDTESIEQARLNYNKLLQHKDAHLYNFPLFDIFCLKVQKMGEDVFYQFITNTEEEFVAMKFSSYNTVVPANAYVHAYGKAGKHFEESIFEQMDVVDVLKHDYRIESAQSHMVDVVSISDTVQAVEANIVALSEVSGLSLGTGMLIRPRLVLTARHCIEDTTITQLNVHLNFQKSADGSITPITYEVQGIAEEDLELDYAILLLREKVETFNPVNIGFDDGQIGNSIFIHHPGGWIKKVSVHNTLEAPTGAASIAHSSFHDSMKGSSGGVYIDAVQRICAIHLLNTEGVTYARYMSELYKKSEILQRSFDNHGNWQGPWIDGTARRVHYHDEETYWDTVQKRQDVFYSFYQEGAKPLFSQVNPTKKELKQIINEIDSMSNLRTKRSTESGYRRDFVEVRGKNGWRQGEIQKDGVKGKKTTVAEVAYEDGSLNETEDLNIVKVGLRVSLDRGYSITIEAEDLTQLVQNKDNTAELTQYFERMIDTEIAAQSNPPKKVAKSKKKGSYEYSSLEDNSIEYWLSYEEEAIEKILKLRLKSQVEEAALHTIKITKAKIIDKSASIFTLSQINLLTREIVETISTSKTVQTLLVPFLIEKGEFLYHWVGMVVMKQNSELKISYLDSENQLAPSIIRESLIYKLQDRFLEMKISFKCVIVEQQKYNNCGLELIENFVFHLTGTRITQEEAPYLHNDLWMQKIILDDIKSNINFIEKPLLDRQVNTENTAYQLIGSVPAYVDEIRDQIDLSWQLKKWLYARDVNKFNRIMQKYNIAKSVDELKDAKPYSFSIELDDKELENDVLFVAQLKKKLNLPIGMKEIEYLQPLIYKANIAFKAFDTAIDTTRLLYVPTIDNAKKALMDVTYVYAMCKGINGISLIPIGYQAIAKYQQIGLSQTIIDLAPQILITASYMLLSTMISAIGTPYIGFLYSAGLAVYSGYNSIFNSYSFYNEFNQKNFMLNSNIAYKNITEILAATSLKHFYDFASRAKEYEKTAYKIQLETKGKFGQKLYEYIYSPMIEEKYELQNKVTQGILTEEEADNSKAKHIKTTDYDHCMEILKLKEEDTQSDHYYCYSEEQQILDHIIIVGESYVEKISSL